MEPFTISAPGRVCLFGEHQDYLGLSVIPSAIDMRTSISCKNIDAEKDMITIHAIDLGKTFQVPITGSYNLQDPEISYFEAVLTVFTKKKGHHDIEGFECEVSSQIPIKSGLSSSAALLVAWAGVINHISGTGYSRQEIGMIAYEAEHHVMGIPCGMMDQLSSSIGGIIHLECIEPPAITTLDANLEGLVVADTRIHKSTSQVHGRRVAETKAGLEHLGELVKFDLKSTPWSKVEPFVKQLDQIERNRLIAVFKDRDITSKSLQLLQQANLDYNTIGALLTEHQKYLREYFEVSVEKIDTIIEAAISAGAQGGKLTGAGLGGSIVLLAKGCEDQVCKAVAEVDGRPYKVEVDTGVSK